ncbi:MAG: hypothetical protein QXR53_04710 [Candidatus Norongarragalinales archaeon]
MAAAGCIFQEKPIEQRQERPSPSPLFQATASAEAPNESAQTRPSPSPIPSPSPDVSPSPSPSPAVQGECVVSINPKDAQGPFKAIASARFFNTPNPGSVTIKCTADGEETEAEKHGEFYIASCSYSFVVEKKVATVSAQTQGISCATTVVIDVNSEFRKGWTFTPGDEEFTVNKSISNTTVRNYTVANSGSLTLTEISCSTNAGHATMTCPATLKPGEEKQFTTTFDATALNAGQHSAVITIKEKDLEKSFTLIATVVN